jgi:sugar-specific transcriptional regulator TrmB
MQKGLVSSVLKGKRNVYAAEPPERLVNYGKSRLDDMRVKIGEVEAVVDNLRFLQKGERPTVKFFEGPEGLKSILRDLVASKPERIQEIVNIDALYHVFSGKELEEAHKILGKSKAKSRALLSGKVTALREGVKAKMVPKELSFDGDLLVYGDKIVLASYTDRIMGVLVENAAMARTFDVLFELAWRGAKEFPQFGKTPS